MVTTRANKITDFVLQATVYVILGVISTFCAVLDTACIIVSITCVVLYIVGVDIVTCVPRVTRCIAKITRSERGLFGGHLPGHSGAFPPEGLGVGGVVLEKQNQGRQREDSHGERVEESDEDTRLCEGEREITILYYV